jgi:hypothetical protein
MGKLLMDGEPAKIRVHRDPKVWLYYQSSGFWEIFEFFFLKQNFYRFF